MMKIKSQVVIKKKKKNTVQVFYSGSGEATPAQYTLDKKHQRGCCRPSASDSTFLHLYYKKCASSSKLTVLSKVPPLQLGICLSGLALFTGCFLLVCSSWGAVVGVFLVGWGLERGSFCEFYFGFWWIRKQGICQPVTQLYWNMIQTASIWSTEGAEKFFWGGLEISKPVFKEGLVSLKKSPRQ